MSTQDQRQQLDEFYEDDLLQRELKRSKLKLQGRKRWKLVILMIAIVGIWVMLIELESNYRLRQEALVDPSVIIDYIIGVLASFCFGLLISIIGATIPSKSLDFYDRMWHLFSFIMGIIGGLAMLACAIISLKMGWFDILSNDQLSLKKSSLPKRG